MSLPKDKRNAQIYKDYLKGMGLTELILKYKLSQTRIIQIINKVNAIEKKLLLGIK